MIINKKVLALKEIIDKNSGFSIQHVKITADKYVAVDGKILIELKNSESQKKLLSKFPDLEQTESLNDEVYLNVNTIKEIEKNMPKKSDNYFVINKKNNKYIITIPNIKNAIKINQNIPEINYPEIEKTYPQREVKVKIKFNFKLLEKLMKVIKKIRKNRDEITFTIYDSNYPVKIEFEDEEINIQGLILPMC